MKNNSENAQKLAQIMEIKVNGTEQVEVLTRVENFISDSHKFYIVTPNPELVLMAQTNEKLKNALNDADLSIPDGVGLKFAKPSLEIIKGRELFLDLIKLADRKKWKVFLLGGLSNEAELAANKLQERYKDIKILSDQGPRLNNRAEPLVEEDVEIEEKVIGNINKFAPELLFVAFGNPKQEIWIHQNLSKLNIGGAMCVGGTLRYIAGISKLPPRWMAGLGLEWLWRGLTEPKRIGRIFRAIIIFPLRLFIYKIKHL
jgi:N-acetylglucosaminyldiphosphoundecaprenol N-acetyl-beta-D-mannosaminyltransferase